MKKIGVITMGVRLNGEKGYTRFRSVAELLVKEGYAVELITTTFQHWEKAQRDVGSIRAEDYPFALFFVYEPGYTKNVDWKRIRSHAEAARNLKKHLREQDDYDLLYAEIPPNDVALAAAEYAQEKGIPFVADVNDLWPEAMKMVFDVPLVSSLLFRPLLRDAEKVYSLVSGVVGTSDEYRDRPFRKTKRDIPRETVCVGNELSVFDAGAAEKAGSIEQKADGDYWVGYAGTIGTSYDIKTMVLAAEVLKRRGLEGIRFRILGGGPDQESLERLAAEKVPDHVKFVGYAPYPEMAAYLVRCDVLVNSFVKKAPQSIVTKIGDYLAAGRPMINTLSSPEFRAKVEHDGFGVNIEAEDPVILADAIERLYRDPEGAAVMGKKARRIAEEQFDRPRAYRKILTLIGKLL